MRTTQETTILPQPGEKAVTFYSRVLLETGDRQRAQYALIRRFLQLDDNAVNAIVRTVDEIERGNDWDAAGRLDSRSRFLRIEDPLISLKNLKELVRDLANTEDSTVSTETVVYLSGALSGHVEALSLAFHEADEAMLEDLEGRTAAEQQPDPHIEWVCEYRELIHKINASSADDEVAGRVDALEARQDALAQKIVSTPPKTPDGVRALCEVMEVWRAIGDIWSDDRDKKAWDLIKAAI